MKKKCSCNQDSAFGPDALLQVKQVALVFNGAAPMSHS